MTLFDYLKNIFLILIILQIAPSLVGNLKKQYSLYFEQHAHVGIISIRGLITDSGRYIKQIQTLFKDDDIKAILLKIDCHGSATGTGEALFNEINALKKEYQKPVIALVENIAASGGYLIGCAADYIIAPGMSVIGSIGVAFPYLFQLDQFINHHNIGYVDLKAGKYKTATDPFVPMNQEEKDELQKVVNSSYDQFVQYVATSRKLSPSDAQEWANARIFTGLQAKQLGLIDEIGSISQAIKALKDKALIEGEIVWVRQQERTNIWSLIMGDNDSQEDDGLYSSIWRSFFSYIHAQQTTMYA